MRVLEEFLKPTQNGLFKTLSKLFKGTTYMSKGNFIVVEGEAPIMLVAHLDTVHREPVREICKSKGGEILMSPQGIGGDDRCGVYALVNAYEMSKKKPWLLFTCDEEVGGVGARRFCTEHKEGCLPKGLDNLKLLVEIDRRGSNDAVYYDCDNAAFEKYISSKGFVTAYGSFSDISLVAPELGVAAVNLSSGYYNPHCLHEYINRRELDDVVKKVVEIIGDAAKNSFPKYRYVEKVHEIRQWVSSYLPIIDTKKLPDFSDEEFYFETRKKLPSEYRELYDELLEFYTAEELESYRENFGNEVIYQLYVDEYGPFYAEYENEVSAMKDLTLRQAAELWVSSSVDGIRTCIIEALMDYDPENWREITLPVIGSTVYVCGKGDEGEIVGYVERVKKFKIRLRNERICYAKADELEVSFFEPLPMWGTMWSFSDNLDQYWLEERGGLEEMSKCGFRIFEHDNYGCYFGIDGAGYDFYEQHWIPLYLARGLHWHKEVVEK